MDQWDEKPLEGVGEEPIPPEHPRMEQTLAQMARDGEPMAQAVEV